jgi:hypothetical protein
MHGTYNFKFTKGTTFTSKLAQIGYTIILNKSIVIFIIKQGSILESVHKLLV